MGKRKLITLTPEQSERLYQLYLQKNCSWHDFATICEQEFGGSFSDDAWRKHVLAIAEEQTSDPLREIEMKRQVYRDERTGWAKQNREQARTDYNICLLQDALTQVSDKLFHDVVFQGPEPTARRSMLILLTDWHVGATYDGIFGRYDSDIARERVETLLKEIYKLQMLYRCEHAYVMTLGDMINGMIRRTVQIQNRENVIDQVKIAAELISNFCASLCEIFPSVTYTGCAGNHSRLVENKDNAVKDDRLDSIIDWAVGLFLKNVRNFHQIDPLDTTLTELTIYDHVVWGVHGDHDRFTKNGLQSLCAAMRQFPDIVCAGHLHNAASQSINDILMIRGGSLCGSGDDYTTQKRLTGRPSQTVAIISPDGVDAIMPVRLG